MRKYSKLIILLSIIVIVLAVYYGKTGSLSQLFAQYEIKTIEGDDAVIDRVIIKGDYYSSYLNNEPFILTKDKVQYERDNTLFERFNDLHIAEKVSALQKENRNFMRMKDLDPSNYITQGDKLIYVTVPYTSWGVAKDYLQVETYDRVTKDKSFHQIEADIFMDYSTIESLFVKDNHLYIAISSVEYDVRTEYDMESFHIITYDLASETLVDSYEIELGDEDYHNQMTEVFPDKEDNPNELVIVSSTFEYRELPLASRNKEAERVDPEEIERLDEGVYEEISNVNTIEKIDLQTGERTQLKLTSSIENSYPIAYDGEQLTLVSPSNKGELIISTYDLATHKINKKFIVETNLKMFSVWDFSNNIIDEGKVYMLMSDQTEKRAQLIVIDSQETSLLYNGSVELQMNDPFLYDDSEVYFHTLELIE